MNDWNIQSRAHSCQACGRRFEGRQVYHTLLFDEKQEFKRLDVCEACWQAQYSEGGRHRKGFVSYWQGIYEAPPPPAPDPVRKETVESLLRRIMERNDPKDASASYILAVMLERKRLLKVKEQLQRDGRRVFVYEDPRSGDLFTIPDPDLQLDQLEQVQRDVALLLEHGLNPPPPPPDPIPEPAAGPASAVPATAEAAEPAVPQNPV
ncbi:MAG: hypothetical protein JXQ71_00115 [Verrucomicrobia bacterium]|nr:hypothetical protein [Verrucomicrobiota bacterium]